MFVILSKIKLFDKNPTINQDGETGSKFILLWEIIKKLNNIYERTVFKILDIKKQKTVICENQETKVRPMITPT